MPHDANITRDVNEAKENFEADAEDTMYEAEAEAEAGQNVPHQLIKWFFSYLQQRSQRVRIGTHHSSWLQLNGGMPQGSWLGPMCFLALVDDLAADCLIHKYVDDTTLTEVLRTLVCKAVSSSYLAGPKIMTWL